MRPPSRHKLPKHKFYFSQNDFKTNLTKKESREIMESEFSVNGVNKWREPPKPEKFEEPDDIKEAEEYNES